MYRKTYSTARSVIGILILVGWISVGLGGILFLVGFSTASDYRADTTMVLFAFTPAIVLVIGGLAQVALALVGHAVLDQADISRATLEILYNLASRAGIQTEDVGDPAKTGAMKGQSDNDGTKDSLGFNASGERIYRGTLIKRLEGRYYVDGREFSTLGQAKRYVDHKQ